MCTRLCNAASEGVQVLRGCVPNPGCVLRPIVMWKKSGGSDWQRSMTSTYRLNLPAWMRIHNNINARRLSPWKGNEVNGITPPPAEPEIVEGEEFYEVEEILDSRYRWRKLRFLVRWKGYDESYDTWEPADELEANAPEAVKDFYRKHPNAPK